MGDYFLFLGKLLYGPFVGLGFFFSRNCLDRTQQFYYELSRLVIMRAPHKLNMEFDLQSLFGLLFTVVLIS